jgi:hypothetical protein
MHGRATGWRFQAVIATILGDFGGWSLTAR